MGLIVLLLATFGCELATGVMLIVNAHDMTALDILENVLATSLLIGIARAWELVGARDTGLFSSLAVLSGRDGAARHFDERSSTPNDSAGD